MNTEYSNIDKALETIREVLKQSVLYKDSKISIEFTISRDKDKILLIDKKFDNGWSYYKFLYNPDAK